MQMKDFYHAHYSSNIMCLTVYGSQSLDDLETVVTEKFAAVPNSNLPPANIPSKKLQEQNIIKQVFLLLQPLISFFRKPQLVKRTPIPYNVCRPCSLAKAIAVQEMLAAGPNSEQPAAVFPRQALQATVICLCTSVTVCYRLGVDTFATDQHCCLRSWRRQAFYTQETLLLRQ